MKGVNVERFMCPKKTYHKSSSPVSVYIRASTHIRRLKQNERLSFWCAGRGDNVDGRIMDIKLVEHSEHSGSCVRRTALGRVCDSEHSGCFGIFMRGFKASNNLFRSHLAQSGLCLADDLFTLLFTTAPTDHRGMSLITFPI